MGVCRAFPRRSWRPWADSPSSAPEKEERINKEELKTKQKLEVRKQKPSKSWVNHFLQTYKGAPVFPGLSCVPGTSEPVGRGGTGRRAPHRKPSWARSRSAGVAEHPSSFLKEENKSTIVMNVENSLKNI